MATALVFIQIYPSKRGLLRRKQWMARISSTANREPLFRSTEGYNNRTELRELCEDVFPGADIQMLPVHPDKV